MTRINFKIKTMNKQLIDNNVSDTDSSSFLDTFNFFKDIFKDYKNKKMLDANLKTAYFKYAKEFYTWIKNQNNIFLGSFSLITFDEISQLDKLDKKITTLNNTKDLIYVKNYKNPFIFILSYSLAYEIFLLISKQIYKNKVTKTQKEQPQPWAFHKHKNGIYRSLKKKFPNTKIKGKQHKFYYSKHNKR